MHLSAEEIYININKIDIIKGVSIDLKDKKFIGIVGPNGCGKTTFLKSIYRVLKPRLGNLIIDEKNLRDIPIKESAKKLGVVGQHNFYNFDFSVLEMVLMGRSPHKKLLEIDNDKDYKIAFEALEKVNMSHFAQRSYNTLSGGEQQRVILARALAQEVKILVLDEPTNHLDIKYQLQLLSLVKNLGIEVLAAIHDLNLAAMYCDNIYIMKDGKIHSSGSPKEVLTKKNIKDVFDVDVNIISNKNDSINIQYHIV